MSTLDTSEKEERNRPMQMGPPREGMPYKNPALDECEAGRIMIEGSNPRNWQEAVDSQFSTPSKKDDKPMMDSFLPGQYEFDIEPQTGRHQQTNPAEKPEQAPLSTPTAYTPTNTQAVSEPTPPKVSNIQEVIDWLEERKAAIHFPSKDELERERRRQRTAGMIAGVSDMSRALANLFATTQYAPNAYDPNHTMSAKMQERFDRLNADRQAREKEYYNYAMTAAKLKDAQEAKEYQHARDALSDALKRNADERAALKSEYEAKKAQAYIDYMVARGDKAGYDAAIAKQKAEFEAERQRLEREKAQAYTRYQNERSRGGRSSGGGGGGRGRGGSGKGSQGYYSDTVIERDLNGKEVGRRVDKHPGTRPKKKSTGVTWKGK